jgi:phosphate:Na+ symporter
MGTMVLLDLMGGVALLLWGLYMVRSGILRTFGADLRRHLSRAIGNRFSGFTAGLILTAILQSSTATGLMTASFTSAGMVALVPALAIMLGANVGTTLIVQVLSLNVSAAAPILLVAGLVAFRSGNTRAKDLGRVGIGLGLMLLALHTLLDTLAPAENAPNLRTLLDMVTSDPMFCVLFAAALTWAAHSSVATILLIMSLAYSQFITPDATIALVVGANLGSAINPVFEAAQRGDPSTYRLPIGNLLNRAAGVAIVLPFLGPIAGYFHALQPDMAKMTAEFHIAFNVALAVLFIGLLDPLAWLLAKAFPAPARPSDPFAPRHLDDAALDMPSLALADAARETLRMGDLVETMLRNVMTALMTNDRDLVAQVSRADNAVDRLDEAIKLYVTKLTRGSLDEREGRRAMEIISFAINLEHMGDIIDKNLSELAAKKIKRKLQFSNDGAAEIAAFHKRILESLRLALGTFMSGDVSDARKLLAEKVELRGAELAAAEHHLARLRDGRPESIETSSLHLDVLRDLKRIHSHICSVAYPVLEGAQQLDPRSAENEISPRSSVVAKGRAQPKPS